MKRVLGILSIPAATAGVAFILWATVGSSADQIESYRQLDPDTLEVEVYTGTLT